MRLLGPRRRIVRREFREYRPGVRVEVASLACGHLWIGRVPRAGPLAAAHRCRQCLQPVELTA